MEKIFSLRQAANQLGIHPVTIRQHKAEGGIFVGIGELVGHSWVFREADIAAMRAKLAAQPAPGRKPASGTSRMRAMKPAERFALAAKLKAEGESLEEIRKRLGYSDTSSVSRALKKASAKTA